MSSGSSASSATREWMASVDGVCVWNNRVWIVPILAEGWRVWRTDLTAVSVTDLL